MRKGDLYKSFQYSFTIGRISTNVGDLEKMITPDDCTLRIVNDLHKDKEINRYVVKALESPYILSLENDIKAYVELIPR